MAQYSIDQFSNITGLNKILIRTWENRYSFLDPMRTNTNIRYYDDEMLTKGIKYSILIENGHKISKIVKYENTEVNNLIEEILRISKDKETINSIYISKLVESALFFDQKLFNDTYDLLTKELSVIEFYKDVLMMAMSKISILYLNSKITPANEHFLSENIRIKISSEINNIKSISSNEKVWILFLPENEYHDIGLLFAHLILKKHDHKVIYLGQNTPRESLLQFSNKNHNFLCFINAMKIKNFSDKLCIFLNDFSKSNIYLVERNDTINKKYKNITSVSDIDKFISFTLNTH
jgi:methanogenic corrinoid protein MtbC1